MKGMKGGQGELKSKVMSGPSRSQQILEYRLRPIVLDRHRSQLRNCCGGFYVLNEGSVV
jgi:hypothetical protein